MLNHKKVNQCRICNSQLSPFFNLGKMHLCGLFPKNINLKIPILPLNIKICNNYKCQLVQLSHNYDLKKLFGQNYGYRSGLNPFMINHIKDIYKFSLNLIKKNNSNINILDIGSNDGTLLNFFSKKINRYAVDPTIKGFKRFYKKDIIKLPQLFNSHTSNYFIKKKLKFDLIFTIAMFYDLPNPNEFVKNVSKNLSDNGYWIMENSYLHLMLKKNSFDTICHEHLEYYTIQSLNYLLNKHKLYINNIRYNDINGGSFQLVISKEKKQSKKTIKLILNEKKINSYIIKNFINKIKKIKNRVNVFVNKNLNYNNFYVYGASTKGNTILSYFNLDSSKFKLALDVNKEKNNRYTPGSKILIINDINRINLSNCIFFVNIWHFKTFIIKKEKKLLKLGVKFLFPMPTPHIIFLKNNRIMKKYI